MRILLAFVQAVAFAASGAAAAADDPLATLSAAYARAVAPGEKAEQYRELLGMVFDRVQRGYAREVDVAALAAEALKTLAPIAPGSGNPAEVFRKAVNAALESLDPHSRYLDAREQSQQRSAFAGSFGGLGMEVDMSEGLVRVVSSMEGTPAARAGLKSGDLIVRFDDQPVLGMTLADAIARLRGDPGTPVALLIRRPGRPDEFTVSLVRETIRRQTLKWSMEGEVLVLRLSGFTRSVKESLEQAVAQASEKTAPRGIVLDMRGNPGGLLGQAVTTADLFLSRGEIVSLRGRTPGNRRSWQADATEVLAGVPMVVLVDGRSASASELVAAALQDNGRAVVMGQRSYGKGSVQTFLSLGGDRGALRLTTALYHSPSGRTVQRTGVGPDIELVAGTGQPAARARRREADRPHALPGADEPAPPKARVEQERCPGPQAASDAALACALAYLGSGTIGRFLDGLGSASAH